MKDREQRHKAGRDHSNVAHARIHRNYHQISIFFPWFNFFNGTDIDP